MGVSMKKLILSLATALVAGAAYADAGTQPASCGMNFKVHIDSVLLSSGGSGRGYLVCRNAAGQLVTKAPVNITIRGIGLGLGVFDFVGVAGNLGILNPGEIEGTYAVVEVAGAFGPGASAALGFKGQNNGLSFTGNLNIGHGIGFMVNGTTWTITSARK